VLSGDGFENTPEVVTYSANQNDKLFLQTSKNIQDNICFAHLINPSIMGIKVAGSLGNAQELEMSYNIWEKNVVMPIRDIMEEIGNSLLQIAGIEGTVSINGYKIIGDQVLEEDSTVSQTAEILSAMSPLLANKILENLTINEIREMAGLQPVDDGDVVASKSETDTSQFANAHLRTHKRKK